MIEKEMVDMCEFIRSFSHNESCDVSTFIAKMESFDSIAKTDTNESMAKKDSTDLITEVDSNQDVESLGVDSRDSIPEIYSNKKFDADSVHQLKEFEKEGIVVDVK
ncbi:uncharacterized protein LOC111211803 [Brassica napus]|uniref:uncharacterized protein LOC111211803 n=2 Tax=Brassica TaxID=3705 RepID=UPI00207986A1|nr:uncharacterized protein LOC111211803 [Brassica napus]